MAKSRVQEVDDHLGLATFFGSIGKLTVVKYLEKLRNVVPVILVGDSQGEDLAKYLSLKSSEALSFNLSKMLALFLSGNLVM